MAGLLDLEGFVQPEPSTPSVELLRFFRFSIAVR